MLDKRLQAIADRIPQHSIVADIGTDHGYLPVELINLNKAKFCYACDIAEGPLNSAKKTIERARLEDKINTILCNGLNKVPTDANVAVIAGMGWMTAKTILEDDFHRLNQFDLIIVQINRDAHLLREWIITNNFNIEFEEVVYHRHYYVIIGFNPKKINTEDYTVLEVYFGKALLNSKNNVTREYFEYLIKKKEAILNKINKDDNYQELLQQITFLSNTIKS